MSAEATRDPQVADAVRQFDARVRAEVAEWLGRAREDGGYGLPADIAASRALMLLCIIEGLKVRGAREPELDKDRLRLVLDEIIVGLVTPPGS